MALAARLLHSWGLGMYVFDAVCFAYTCRRLIDLSNDCRYHEHMVTVKEFYRGRRGVMQAAAEKHLTGLASWSLPSAGTFFWFDLSPSGITDSASIM